MANACSSSLVRISVSRDIAFTRWTIVWSVLSVSLHGLSPKVEPQWTKLIQGKDYWEWLTQTIGLKTIVPHWKNVECLLEKILHMLQNLFKLETISLLYTWTSGLVVHNGRCPTCLTTILCKDISMNYAIAFEDSLACSNVWQRKSPLKKF